MGLASFGLDVVIFCGFLYSFLLHVLSAIPGLDFLGLALALSQLQACGRTSWRPAARTRPCSTAMSAVDNTFASATAIGTDHGRRYHLDTLIIFHIFSGCPYKIC
jgi:hypothetical protein